MKKQASKHEDADWERECRTRLLRIDGKLDELMQQVHRALDVKLGLRPEMVRLEVDDDAVTHQTSFGAASDFKLPASNAKEAAFSLLPVVPEEPPRQGPFGNCVKATGCVEESEAIWEEENIKDVSPKQITVQESWHSQYSVAQPDACWAPACTLVQEENHPKPVPASTPAGLQHGEGPRFTAPRVVEASTLQHPPGPLNRRLFNPETSIPLSPTTVDDAQPPEFPKDVQHLWSGFGSKSKTNSLTSRSQSRLEEKRSEAEERVRQVNEAQERVECASNSHQGSLLQSPSPSGLSNFGSRIGSKGAVDLMRPLDRWAHLVTRTFELTNSTHQLRQCWIPQDEEDAGKKSAKALERQKTNSKDQILDHYVASDKFNFNKRTTRKSSNAEMSSWMELERSIIVAPYSRFRLTWVFVSLGFIMYDTTTLSMEVFTNLTGPYFGLMAWLSMTFWTLDIGMSFATGIFVEGELQMKFRVIARNYITTWMIFDLVLTLPLWMLTLSQANWGFSSFEDAGTPAGFSSSMRVVRLFRVLKVKPVLDVVVDALDSIYLFAISRIVMLTVMVLGWMHLNGVMWFVLGNFNGEDGWVHQNGVDARDPWYQYFTSLQWAAAQLQGSTDVTIGQVTSERAYAVFAILLSVVALTLFISGFTNVLLMVQTALNTKTVRKRWLRDFFDRHRVPYALSVRVRKHFEQVIKGDAKETEENDNEMLGILPTKLRREVLQETRSVYLIMNPVFDAMKVDHPRCFQRICCDAISSMWFMPDEHTFCHGELCTQVYVVLAGQLSYLRYSEIIRVLMSAVAQRGDGRNEAPLSRFVESRLTPVAVGQWLCEAVLWMHWVHRGDMRSISNTTLFAMKVDWFEDIVQNYPNVKNFGQKHAKRFMHALKSQDNESDMFGSIDLLMKHVQSHARTARPAGTVVLKSSVRRRNSVLRAHPDEL